MKDDEDLVQSLLAHDEDVVVRPEHERRIREGLGALLATASAPRMPSAPPEEAPAGELSRGALRHWLTTAIVAAAASAGGFVAGRASAPPPPSVVSVPSSSLSAFAPPRVPLVPSPEPTVVTSTATAPVTSPSAVHASNPPLPSADAFDREQSLLERARSALVHHDADAAESALDEHARQFTRSRYTEERDYLRIQVLRERGDVTRVRERAAAFLANYPDSLLRARVEPLAR